MERRLWRNIISANLGGRIKMIYTISFPQDIPESHAHKKAMNTASQATALFRRNISNLNDLLLTHNTTFQTVTWEQEAAREAEERRKGASSSLSLSYCFTGISFHLSIRLHRLTGSQPQYTHCHFTWADNRSRTGDVALQLCNQTQWKLQLEPTKKRRP